MVEILTVKASESFEVAVTLIYDDHSCVLVDCGPIGTMKQLKEELNRVGKSVEDITDILITHHDHDHIGNLHALKQENPTIKVYASLIEKDYIVGTLEPIRLTQAKELQPTLSKDQQANGIAMMNMFASIQPVAVDVVVSDGEVLDIAGGIQVIATPGHLPGHTAYYAIEDAVLAVGDAMIVVNGELQIANPKFSLDMDEAKKSMGKLCRIDSKMMVCYHGGAIKK